MSDNNLLDSLKDILFGSVAGCTGKLFEYPFDTVKVRLQTTTQFNGAFECMRHTYNTEGVINGFYKGLASPMVGAALETSSLFVFFNLSNKFLASQSNMDPDNLPLKYQVASGAIAGGFASTVLTPVELVKCQLQVDNLYANRNNTIISVIRNVIRDSGVAGLWHGQMGTFIRECGGSASWFGAYEFTRTYLRGQREENTISELLISGGMAGIAYNGSVFPADTIKSRMQTQTVIDGYKHTFIEIANNIYQTSGIRGFYRGLGITLFRAVPSNALIFLTYETLKAKF